MEFEPFTKDELPSMANFNEKLKAVIADGVKIEVGEYDGDGNTSKTLNLPFEPKYLLITSDSRLLTVSNVFHIQTAHCLLVNGITTATSVWSSYTLQSGQIPTGVINVAFSGSKVSWTRVQNSTQLTNYVTDAAAALNASTIKYKYVAIG